jgi:hypothetical protein
VRAPTPSRSAGRPSHRYRCAAAARSESIRIDGKESLAEQVHALLPEVAPTVGYGVSRNTIYRSSPSSARPLYPMQPLPSSWLRPTQQRADDELRRALPPS